MINKEEWKKYMSTGIYFITCIRPKIIKGQLNYGEKNTTRSRCWGWYKKLNEAIKAVEENHTDIHEIDYSYAVIEKVPNGVLPISKVVQWFIWVGDSDKGQYKKCEAPEWSQHICGWSIG